MLGWGGNFITWIYNAFFFFWCVCACVWETKHLEALITESKQCSRNAGGEIPQIISSDKETAALAIRWATWFTDLFAKEHRIKRAQKSFTIINYFAQRRKICCWDLQSLIQKKWFSFNNVVETFDFILLGLGRGHLSGGIWSFLLLYRNDCNGMTRDFRWQRLELKDYFRVLVDRVYYWQRKV